MTNSTLDYSAFRLRYSFIKSTKEGVRRNGLLPLIFIFVVLTPFVVFLCELYFPVLLVPREVSYPSSLLLFIFISAVLFARSGRKHLLLQRFADDNKLMYLALVSPFSGVNTLDHLTEFPSNSLLFNQGSSRYFATLFKKDNWYIGNYQYTTGSGKSRQTHRFGIIAMRLGKNLPHTVFDSKKNNFLFSNLPTWFDSSQKISLEGNFDDYFQAYMPDSYHIDVMSYITPEIMQLLIQVADQYDIEIVDNMLYIYKSGTISYQNDSNRLLSTISKLSDELVQNSESYRDQRASATAAPETHQVATAGKRLRQRNFALLSLLPIGLFFVSSITSTSQYMMFTPLVVTVVVFILVFIKRGR